MRGATLYIPESTFIGIIMSKKLLLAIGLLAAAPMFTTLAHAQGAAQTVVNYKVDVTSVSTGFRSSKVVGAEISNTGGDKIGTVDDLLVTRNDRVVYAIISVGGFLGVGEKLVAVPFSELQLTADKTVFAGATKETLLALPKFAYAK
jgi:hypothetical protein